MKQIICILALLLMSVTTTKAQTSPATPSIRGKILTEEKQPIEFANIALLSEDSTFIQGTCSRSDGSFELLPPAPGNYLLQVSSIGYKPLCQPCPTGLSVLGLLSRFVGMLTDSRSFLSYPRHEYFRRTLCNLVGRDVENGEIPISEMERVNQMIEDISYYNAKNFFQF